MNDRRQGHSPWRAPRPRPSLQLGRPGNPGPRPAAGKVRRHGGHAHSGLAHPLAEITGQLRAGTSPAPCRQDSAASKLIGWSVCQCLGAEAKTLSLGVLYGYVPESCILPIRLVRDGVQIFFQHYRLHSACRQEVGFEEFERALLKQKVQTGCAGARLVIPALRRLRPKDPKLEPSLGVGDLVRLSQNLNF